MIGFLNFDFRVLICRSATAIWGYKLNEHDMKARTKRFALDVIRLVGTLPKTTEGKAIGNQWVRSGSSVGANYRAACRGTSKADFVSRLGIVEEEADESLLVGNHYRRGNSTRNACGTAAQGSKRDNCNRGGITEDCRRLKMRLSQTHKSTIKTLKSEML